jgi:MmyB-like transcription regulator ligand binding domain
MTNECAPRFFNCFIDMTARKGPRNMLHLMFDPKGMRPFIANWQDVAKSLFERVYRESIRARMTSHGIQGKKASIDRGQKDALRAGGRFSRP